MELASRFPLLTLILMWEADPVIGPCDILYIPRSRIEYSYPRSLGTSLMLVSQWRLRTSRVHPLEGTFTMIP